MTGRMTGVAAPPRPAGTMHVDRFVVPSGDDAVLRHFVDHLFVAHSAGGRLRGLGARLSLRLGLPSVSRRLLRGGKAGPPQRPHAAAEIRCALGRAGLDPEGSWIQLLDYAGADRCGSVTFVFPPGAAEPSAVVKARPTADAETSLRRERCALMKVRGRLPPELRATLPEPLAHTLEEDTEILALSFLRGRPAYTDMQSRLLPGRQVDGHMRCAALWLARFHEAAADPEAALDPERDLPEPAQLRERIDEGGWPPSSLADPDLRWYARLRERIARRPLHGCAVHGDFWARNLLLPGAPLPSVVDWEHHEPVGCPARDLFHFPLTYGLNHPWIRYRRSPPLAAFRRTFLERNRVSCAVRDYFTGYARLRGLDPGLLRELFLLRLLAPEAAGLAGPSGATPAGGAPWIAAYILAARATASALPS